MRGDNLKTHFQLENIPVGCISPAFRSSSSYWEATPFPVHAGKPTLSQCMLGSQAPLFPLPAGKPTPFPNACWEPPLPSACWEANPPMNRMTHWCKNITLPRTSFAGGKYLQTQPVITIQGKKHHLTFHTQTFNCSVIAQTYCLLPKLLMIKGLYSWILCGPQHIFDLLENAD